MNASSGGASSKPQQIVEFVPEQFCDEAYDLADDYLAEAMDEMERELKAAVKSGSDEKQQQEQEQRAAEEKIKTACDNVQKRLQTKFDYNLDIFDRYVKKHFLVAKTAVGPGAPVNSSAGTARGTAAQATAEPRDAEQGLGAADAKRAKVGSSKATWGFPIDEGSAPKRLEEEAEVDADLQRLRQRRREALRRRGAMEKKGIRLSAVLQDVSDFVEALQMGVSSSFDDNGLTPVPAKVQEAVESSAELRAIAARAQGLTRRVGELKAKSAEDAGGGASSQNGSGDGKATGSSAGNAVSRPTDLQAVFERSRDQQVIGGGGMAGYSALGARLNG